MVFLLPPEQSTELSIVHQEALHTWVTGQVVIIITVGDKRDDDDTAKDDNYPLQFTYAHLQRMCHQLSHYPNNHNWCINIGGGWDIQQQQDYLHVIQMLDNAKQQDMNDAKLGMNNIQRHPGSEPCVVDFHSQHFAHHESGF